jgi:acetyl-CoA synthetase
MSTTDTDFTDRVPADATGNREIGFAVPDRYNASAILFDNLAAGRGNKTALFSPGGDLTYGALCESACRIGAALASLDLARGERVLLLLDDTPVYAAAIFGALRAGFVPVLVNTLSTPDLVSFYLRDSDARVVLFDAAYEHLLGADVVGGVEDLTLVSVNGNAAPEGVGHDLNGDTWFTQFPAELDVADTGRDDMAFWMYSSGSTGQPKGVVHLHHDMAYTVQSYALRVLGIQEDDICFSVPKIFFAYGFGNSLTFPFAVGASAVLFAGRPTPASVFECVTRFRPTLFFGLPTLYTALVNDPAADSADFGSVRLCISAAEILSAEVFNAWHERFGHAIVEGLGSTEVLHIYLSNTPERRKTGSAGLRVPGYELKLTDRDGAPVVTGEEGILWVRGDSNAPCYWGRPEKTAETMRNGWIYTGDRFVVDADGFHFFRGRADDLIKISGQWVYPLEIELCLNEHPAVRECAVLAVTLANGLNSLKAYVALKDTKQAGPATSAALQAFVKERLLPHKYPRVIEYLDDLPKTGTSKIDRQALLRTPSDSG